MKNVFLKLSLIVFSAMSLFSCKSDDVDEKVAGLRYQYPDILDIRITPEPSVRRVGCFTDAGSWMGFTIPQSDKWLNGFCGPFSIDNRYWFAQTLLEVGFAGKEEAFAVDSVSYFPGEVYMKSSSESGNIEQRMIFVNSNVAMLHLKSDVNMGFSFCSQALNEKVSILKEKNSITFKHESSEIVKVLFDRDVDIECGNDGYKAKTSSQCKDMYVSISFYPNAKAMIGGSQYALSCLNSPQKAIDENMHRWDGYLNKVLRDDMAYEYDRIAVKAVVTLISNWRSQREGLLHDGIIPSHAVGYFIGFWAWDSWRFSAALARFEPELAKDNIRAMFDYQLPDGMIIDCIYTDPKENNARDSKPPLVCWAVDEIFELNGDTAFVREMYPQLLSYYKWWFNKRDHNRNGMCEFGSTDGTRIAAAWESGMDNAIRFDNAKMLKNADDAWSLDQESVDLNAYLALECRLLKKFANIIGAEFDGPDYQDKVADYFFNPETNFFGDRRIEDGSFISDMGCEAYTPLWTKVARPEQVEKMLPVLTDTAKFSTYIPFPTAAADNPKCDPNGYWRGPIWLDQTYFAIRGLRNYGYNELADEYTLQVFDRLQGLKEEAPIHENYGTHNGERLQAPHFSWSSSHLLMMYEDYGK